MSNRWRFLTIGRFLAVWAVLGGIAVAWQIRAGAYESDLGAHPDEASHFITGLMVRDYLLKGIPEHPMRFAENYYAHYPKVALGHYPPGFYIAEGIWLTVFPVAKWSVLAFLAAQSGLLGALVFAITYHRVGVTIGLVAGMITVSLPITQILASTVMSDLLLSLMCLLSVLAFARFLKSENWRDSLWFGIWAMAAIMVKGSGLLLAVLVPIAITLSRRWHLVRRPALWLGAVPVVLIAGPWMYFTREITAEGMVDKGAGEHLAEVIPYFAAQWVRSIGWVMSLLAAISVLVAVRHREFRRDPVLVCFVSLPVALVLFYALIPAGLDPRYLMPLIAPVIVLAAVGAQRIATSVKSVPVWVPATTLFALAGVEMIRAQEKEVNGWAEIAEHMVEEGAGELVEVLVISDARGEGALVAELAIRDPDRPSHIVQRGSKVLSSSDWLGRQYKGKFASHIELADFLDSERFPWVVVDRSVPDSLRRPYHDQIDLLISSTPDKPLRRDSQFHLIRQPGEEGDATLYRPGFEAPQSE